VKDKYQSKFFLACIGKRWMHFHSRREPWQKKPNVDIKTFNNDCISCMKNSFGRNGKKNLDENPFARSVTGSVASSPEGSESPITAHVVVANNPLDFQPDFSGSGAQNCFSCILHTK